MKPFRQFINEADRTASSYDHDLIKRAVDHFGTTEDHAEAGYILHDGRMLDFSQKKDGGQPGMRSSDHREVAEILDEKDYVHPYKVYGGASKNMRTFMKKTGAVRYHPESGGGFDALSEPTMPQLRTIMRGHHALGRQPMYVDHHDFESGETRSTELRRPNIDSIKAHFRGEE